MNLRLPVLWMEEELVYIRMHHAYDLDPLAPPALPSRPPASARAGPAAGQLARGVCCHRARRCRGAGQRDARGGGQAG